MNGFRIDKITFNNDGYKEILTSAGVQGLVEEHTSAICAKANANMTEEDSNGYKYKVEQGGKAGRWIGVIYSTNWASLRDETENKALSRAVT